MSGRQLIMSVDLDGWQHIRWLYGSPDARYSDLADYYRDVHGTARPPGHLIEPTRRLLDLLDERGAKISFFVLGQIAEDHPGLVREIAERGHEIACHSYRHIDLDLHSRDSFVRGLVEAKARLESIAGRPVLGFRMPNLIVEDWVRPVLSEQGFVYDASICPSRPMRGKFGKYQGCPIVPYRTAYDSFLEGDSAFWELPVPVFPLLKMPGGSGIAMRVFGPSWTRITLRSAARRGVASFYFHPWEISEKPPGLRLETWWQRLFARRAGGWLFRRVDRLLRGHDAISCARFVEAQDS